MEGFESVENSPGHGVFLLQEGQAFVTLWTPAWSHWESRPRVDSLRIHMHPWCEATGDHGCLMRSALRPGREPWGLVPDSGPACCCRCCRYCTRDDRKVAGTVKSHGVMRRKIQQERGKRMWKTASTQMHSGHICNVLASQSALVSSWTTVGGFQNCLIITDQTRSDSSQCCNVC